MINFPTIKKSIVTAVNALFEGDNIQDLVVIENTKKDFEGDLTLVVFSLLKLSKKSPEKTAEFIGNYLLENENYFVIIFQDESFEWSFATFVEIYHVSG